MDVSQWVNLGFGAPLSLFLVWLILTGKLVRRADVTKIREDYQRRLDEHEQRAASIAADRDAWRQAYQEESRARASADTTAQTLASTAAMQGELLRLLETLVGRNRGGGRASP